jgi:hypothetical protein
VIVFGILLLGAVLLCLLAIPLVMACIPFIKFALTAGLLLVLYVVGIGRVMGALDSIDKAVQAAYDRAVPPFVYTPPPPAPIVHRTPRRIPRQHPRPVAPAGLETL